MFGICKRCDATIEIPFDADELNVLCGACDSYLRQEEERASNMFKRKSANE